MSILANYIALISSLIVIILILLTLTAGSKPGLMEGYYIIMVCSYIYIIIYMLTYIVEYVVYWIYN